MSLKWDYETTVKFIQLYKSHQCLWDFSSSDYKIKQKRNAAYIALTQEMNIDGFGVQDAKNKIKSLRSTYSQEIRKVQDSKKSGAGANNVYTSNIKWLHEMEEVFAKDLKKQVYENDQSTTNEATESQASGLAVPLGNAVAVAVSSQEPTHEVGSTPRAKKRTRDIVAAISDLKKINEDINSEAETAWDAFGKSVAMQLKRLSVENALLAQCRIQSIMTEFGIKDHREKTGSRSAMSNYSNRRASSALSDITNVSFVDSPNIYLDESVASPPQESPTSERFIFIAPPTIETSAPQTIYTTQSAVEPVPATSSPAMQYSNNDNDIITAAIKAASAFDSNYQPK